MSFFSHARYCLNFGVWCSGADVARLSPDVKTSYANVSSLLSFESVPAASAELIRYRVLCSTLTAESARSAPSVEGQTVDRGLS